MPKGIPKRGLDEQQLEGGGAGMGSIKQFEKTSPTAEKAEAKIAKGNIGADEVLKNLRDKFGGDKRTGAIRSEVTPSPRSVLEEAQRNKALNKFRREEAVEKATTEGGVTKYPYVEPTEKKKGGLTASRRADGCATRGKTKGRMV